MVDDVVAKALAQLKELYPNTMSEMFGPTFSTSLPNH